MLVGAKRTSSNMDLVSDVKEGDKSYLPNVISKSTNEVKKGNVVINKPGVVLNDMTIDGNLIIGDGVGVGEATLENVTVKGNTVVRLHYFNPDFGLILLSSLL